MLTTESNSPLFTEIERCRICGNSQLESVLDLGFQTLTGVFPKHEAEFVPGGPLELVKCQEDSGSTTCGLVQLKQSYDADRMYGSNYGYRSGLNSSMVGHLAETARKIKERVAFSEGDLVLDIGSNDGTLLKAMSAPGVDLVGVDPSGAKFQEFYPPYIQLIPEFFSAARFRAEFGNRKAKVVTSIAMFYDLEAPMTFMEEVRDVLADDGIWLLEQSYLQAMLDMNSYDTICHEHLEYYRVK